MLAKYADHNARLRREGRVFADGDFGDLDDNGLDLARCPPGEGCSVGDDRDDD